MWASHRLQFCPRVCSFVGCDVVVCSNMGHHELQEDAVLNHWSPGTSALCQEYVLAFFCIKLVFSGLSLSFSHSPLPVSVVQHLSLFLTVITQGCISCHSGQQWVPCEAGWSWLLPDMGQLPSCPSAYRCHPCSSPLSKPCHIIQVTTFSYH